MSGGMRELSRFPIVFKSKLGKEGGKAKFAVFCGLARGLWTGSLRPEKIAPPRCAGKSTCQWVREADRPASFLLSHVITTKVSDKSKPVRVSLLDESGQERKRGRVQNTAYTRIRHVILPPSGPSLLHCSTKQERDGHDMQTSVGKSYLGMSRITSIPHLSLFTYISLPLRPPFKGPTLVGIVIYHPSAPSLVIMPAIAVHKMPTRAPVIPSASPTRTGAYVEKRGFTCSTSTTLLHCSPEGICKKQTLGS
jgi:hypothetical protein